MTSEQELDRTTCDLLAQCRQSSDQSLEISIIVVMADKEEFEALFSRIQRRFNLWRQRGRIPRELFPIEPMMHGAHGPSGPAHQFIGKYGARSYRDIRP